MVMKRVRLSLLYGVLVVLIGLNVLAILQRERIGDWWVLRGYAPSVAVSTLAEQTAMTDDGRHLFYINRPSLEDKAGFNKHCSNHTEHSVVLGCYHGDRQGIYLYDVQDDRLEGVEQVTAAHEMLHQAYERLSGEERQRIDGLLEDFAAHGNLPQRLKDKLDLYKKNAAANLANEMHSIFGTEIAALPAELETYYAQYFTDRKAVVAFSDKYQGEFEARQAKVKAFDKQLSDIDARISTNKAELERQQKALDAQRARVQAFLAAGDTEAYQRGATAYNRQVSVYNALIDETERLIDDYNVIVAQRNAISVEEQELQQALDSRRQESTAQ